MKTATSFDPKEVPDGNIKSEDQKIYIRKMSRIKSFLMMLVKMLWSWALY
jgi:hypothetical protein